MTCLLAQLIAFWSALLFTWTGALASPGTFTPEEQAYFIQILRTFQPSVPSIRAELGTGFFFTHDGLVLTAGHVVTGCRDIRVGSDAIPPVPADIVVPAEKPAELAVLRPRLVQPSSPVPPPLAISHPDERGQGGGALGYPPGSPMLTASEAEGAQIPSPDQRHIITDAVTWIRGGVFRQGFSGGPVWERQSGHVIGVLDAVYDRQKAAELLHADDVTSLAVGYAIVQFFLDRHPAVAAGARAVGERPLTAEDIRRSTVRVVCFQ